ncbi:ATP-dependent DNA helicase [Actinomadura sp. DC4]|uniref:ATP-dependent helicase n=1 Tax=Actinomadura sp. DC4 TaxID=3055069 RepID=UPI0025B05C52|nr:ATP-dependent DNA helicase [Actinomadura sp. DC4]MDN3352739.1 ATP-dependent DNA helicase [Actinomadura sp. DC4]
MIGPQELAQRLGVPEPTPDQAAVIQAPLAPMAVIAGAGSGKSETMAARVVWLVANGFVRPERVLGLTFTRKAAAELSDRVRRRLGQLREHEDLIDPAILDGEPTVSTYHAYAARLFGDHALRAALEPTMRLITPAVAWQIAARVVDAYDGPMSAVEWAPDTVTKAVVGAAGELSEHLRTPDDVRRIGAWLDERFAEVKKPTKTHQGRIMSAQAVREQLLPIVEAYQRAKAKREVFDHGDQLALAARIAHEHREVGTIERSRYGVVLLDEYQDTSHAQLVLLKSLFGGGHPVTAVGDPCQSIYGWRGASAGNLLGFARDFPDGDRPAPMRQLSTSFRNGERILDAAARIQTELREEAKDVPRLWPGAAQQARGRIECAMLETVEDEAERLAARLAALLRQPREIAPDGVAWDHVSRHGPGVQASDIAILARKRSQFPLLRAALEARGIPVEVVGLGGLLTVPEVQDVVATLKVVHDPTAGASLARLLTGPRWRLGPRDLVALGRRARDLAREAARDVHPDAGAPPERTDADPLRQVVEELHDESGSLVDALDDLGPGEAYSGEGRARLERLRDELRVLRRHVGLALPDLVTEVERTLGLDIEVAARTGLDPVTARADLDAFVDAAASFAGDAEDPTLGAFLAYLKAAESEEFGLEAGRVGETNSVKLLTVHAAKGLEWEVVAIPGLVYLPTRDGAPGKGSVFPTSPQSSSRWTTNARTLPYPLRGDRADLPELPGLQKPDIEAFNAATAERDVREERRLAYVAVTRAKHLLITTGYRWGMGSRPLRPSPFLEEIREACEAGAGEVGYWAEEPIGEENPLLADQESATWPVEAPDDERHAALAEGARMVTDAMSGRTRPGTAYSAVPPAERGRVSAWARDVELLLAERDRSRGNDGLAVELPAHLSVSSLVSLARDPAALARQIRRPLPRPPAPYARRGTAFHRWLESRWGQQRLLDLDDLPGASDDGAASDGQLEALQEAFERSAWADREPLDVEVPFETLIGDRLIRGRMDAVFRSGEGYEVVDWKTGRPPSGEEARAAGVQLAAYRLAWAQLAGVEVDRVSAAFHYVAADVTVRPADLLDEAGLTELLNLVPQA